MHVYILIWVKVYLATYLQHNSCTGVWSQDKNFQKQKLRKPVPVRWINIGKVVSHIKEIQWEYSDKGKHAVTARRYKHKNRLQWSNDANTEILKLQIMKAIGLWLVFDPVGWFHLGNSSSRLQNHKLAKHTVYSVLWVVTKSRKVLFMNQSFYQIRHYHSKTDKQSIDLGVLEVV